MNTDQIASFIRWGMGALSGYLLAKGLSQAQLADLTNWLIMGVSVLPGVISVIWGLIKHSDAGKVKAAAAMPGIKIDVLANAPNGAQQVARDPAVPNVVVK